MNQKWVGCWLKGGQNVLASKYIWFCFYLNYQADKSMVVRDSGFLYVIKFCLIWLKIKNMLSTLCSTLFKTNSKIWVKLDNFTACKNHNVALPSTLIFMGNDTIIRQNRQGEKLGCKDRVDKETHFSTNTIYNTK